MPQLDDRAQGFRIAGTITPEPTSSGETRTSEVRLRLVPAVADGHRIAPIAIRYEDRSVVPPRAGWFSTRPLPLEVAPLLGGPAPRAVQADLPLRRRFSFGQPRAAALAATALVALAVALAWIAASRLGRRLQARRLSPRAQALQAIHALLRRRLPEHGRPKDFYLALTLIVRRYIEQVHTVRAPEQTTEEFLVLASHHAAFTPAVLRQLRSFLEAADLVKFAGDRPSPQAVADAVASARDYIEEDACHAPEPPERAKKSSEDGPRGRGPSRIRADAPVSRAGRDGGPAVRRFVRALAAQTPQPLSNHVHAG
jgi:hypothetical protein